MSLRRSPLVVITDLDGALLDHDRYAWEPARRALAELKRRRVPLVICTSKTRAEVLLIRRRLGNAHPFITENGGGLFLPRGYFGERAGARAIALGRPYSEITAALEELARRAGARVEGFHQMTARKLSHATGLTIAEARLAKMREFDEPFRFLEESPEARRRFHRLARRRGLELARGGRFWHLFSGSDKGSAVKRLLALYRRRWRRPFVALALGDGKNDIPLLLACDRAVIVPGPDGRIDRALARRVPGARRAPAPGPAGWNEEVLRELAFLDLEFETGGADLG